jgi:hypothetical protein
MNSLLLGPFIKGVLCLPVRLMRHATPRLASWLLPAIFFAASSAAVHAADPVWPPQPSRLELESPYGKLNVLASEYVYEALLRLDDVPIKPQIRGILNIPYAFSLPKSHAALVSISSGDNDCPIAYRWVILRKTGYKVSPKFGSCSEHIKVSAQGPRFTVRTPNRENPGKIDVYIYDGKTLSQRIAR